MITVITSRYFRRFSTFLVTVLLVISFTSCSAKQTSPSVQKEYPIPVPTDVLYAGSVRGATFSLDGIFWFTEPVTT